MRRGKSEIELVVLILLNAALWGPWCRGLFGVSRLGAPWRVRAAIAGTAALALAMILVVLLTASSRDVRGSVYYILSYEAFGGVWLAGALGLFPFFGVSLRDDVIERRNRAAFWVASGALLGSAVCFAGANAGDGPGPAAVVFCAALASTAFFLVWFLAEVAGAHWTDAVTIDRDPASGLRLGSLLLSAGVAFGSAESGDWVSAGATVRDFFVRGWPLAPALGVALLAERPLRRASGLLGGWLAAAVYLLLTAACIALERRTR